MTDKEREYYEKRYRHLNLCFAHGRGWDHLTLTAALVLDSYWPKLPFWLKHLWYKILPGNYRMTKLEILLQKIHLLEYLQTPSYKFIQIKEKFGGLCLYCLSTPQSIQFLESESYNRCEFCGTNQNLGRTQGWIKTCCEECSKEYLKNRGSLSPWIKLKQ